MRVLPVLDLLEGKVVRGVAGRRDQYRPVQSLLADGSDPDTIAEAIRSRFGLREFYVADLDAILHRRPNLSIMRSLNAAGFCLLADAGIERCDDAAAIFETGVKQIVAGLETLAGPRELARLVERWGPDRIVFSLDLRDGQPLGDRSAWAQEPFEIARQAIAAGSTQLIVLDIARVGTAGGIPTLPLCRQIRQTFPQTTLITGGGVRTIDDLADLVPSGIDAVLIASALHNGAIRPDDLRALQ